LGVVKPSRENRRTFEGVLGRVLNAQRVSLKGVLGKEQTKTVKAIEARNAGLPEPRSAVATA
jgi:hypothetical protein